MRRKMGRATHWPLHGDLPFHDIALIGDYFDVGERGREEFVEFLRCQLVSIPSNIDIKLADQGAED
jgi:hypothetical protein